MSEIQFIDINDITIAYTVEGKGKPLIFLHGNGGNHSDFDETVQTLAPYFTCYCLDTRGHGQSSPVNEYHYRDMASDVNAFIEKLGLSDVAICGFSDGGIVGLMVAASNKAVTNLITCGANITPFGVSLRTLLNVWKEYKKTGEPRLKLMIVEPHISKKELEGITAKTLIAAGENDLILMKHTKKIAKAIPGSTIRIIRGEDHGSYIVHSDKLGRLLKKWFRIA